MSVDKINIRPGVSVLSVLSRLNYRPWYAIAEFVDNAIQSAQANKELLHRSDGSGYKLEVEVDIDTSGEGKITIRDNAAGISEKDYPRAFRAAELPPDRSGLSEFGMGMKSAACWFARSWSAKTKAINEQDEKTVLFDIGKIVEDKIEELKVSRKPGKKDLHYTEIVLCDLYNVPHGRTIGKIKEHLASIYRDFIRKDFLVLKFKGEKLEYKSPVILNAPEYRTPSGKSICWKKDISFDFGNGMSVHGFAAIRERASVSESGFALFRRGRVVQGSADDGYRPEKIFGKPNSYTYQRLFGELHLDGMNVSHTKDGFKWDDTEEPFLDLLKEHLDNAPMCLLEQAEGYRARQTKKTLESLAGKSVETTAQVLNGNQGVLSGSEGIAEEMPLPKELPSASTSLKTKSIEIALGDDVWVIEIEACGDRKEWLDVSFVPREKSQDGKRHLKIRIDLASKFMEQYVGADQDRSTLAVLMGAGIAIAMAKVRDAGAKYTGQFIKQVNTVLDKIGEEKI